MPVVDAGAAWGGSGSGAAAHAAQLLALLQQQVVARNPDAVFTLHLELEG